MSPRRPRSSAPSNTSINLLAVIKANGVVFYNGDSAGGTRVYTYNSQSATNVPITPASLYVQSSQFYAGDHRGFFVGYDTAGNETGVYVTDGTSAGTHSFAPASGFSALCEAITVGDLLYYTASYSDGTQLKTGLFVSDGTAAGTTMIKANNLFSSSSITSLAYLNGNVYFEGYDDNDADFSNGPQVYRVAVPELTLLPALAAAGAGMLKRRRKREPQSTVFKSSRVDQSEMPKIAAFLFSRQQRRIVEALVDAGVRHIVIGGFAVRHHGVERPAADFDLWIDPSPTNYKLFAATLKTFGIDLGDQVLRRLKIGNEQQCAGTLDLVTELVGEDFATRFIDAEIATFEGISLTVIGLDQLIAHKRDSGRKRDLGDVAALEGLFAVI